MTRQENTTETDNTGQLDSTFAQSEQETVRRPGDRTATETAAGSTSTTRERGYITFSFVMKVNIQTPCKRVDYS